MDCIGHWRNWIRPLVFSIYFILLLIALPLSVWELNRIDAPANVQAWFIGGIFTMMAIPISLWGILQHLIYYTKPHLQKSIIRILWMVPIYSLNSWFALMFPSIAIYLNTLRECYEAYVIYSFMTFLLNFLYTEYPDLDIHLENKPTVSHLIPFCCLPRWPMGSKFINRCKHGVLQYTVIRPVTTVIALICELTHSYHDGVFDFKSGWSYLVIINNVSQVWSLYSLILFYRATKEELSPIKPVSKFLCVKMIIFMTFWQSVLLAILANTGVIQKVPAWKLEDIDSIVNGLQDFAICVEMLFFALAHYYSFSHKPYVDSEIEQIPCCESFMSMWDISDVRDDVVEHVKVVGKGFKKHVPGIARRQASPEARNSSERTPLLSTGSESDRLGYASDSSLTPHLTISAEVHNQASRPSITDSMINYVKFGSSIESEGSMISQRTSTVTSDETQTTSDNVSGILVDIPENSVFIESSENTAQPSGDFTNQVDAGEPSRDNTGSLLDTDVPENIDPVKSGDTLETTG